MAAAVKKLIADYPLSKPLTSRFMRRVDLGEYSPLELASLCMIWQGLSAEQRREIERQSAIPRRHEAMKKAAESSSLSQEITLPDFDEAGATKKFEEFATKNRPMLLFPEPAHEEGNRTTGAGEILVCEVINFYFSEHLPKAVTPKRLSQFLATFPPWLQTAFDPHSPEEAQRRLTIVYRRAF